MSEPNTLHLYRNSTLDGTPTPFDILLSAGLILKTFSDETSDPINLPSAPDLLIIYGDGVNDCFLQLGDDIVAAIPADGTFISGLHYIPAGVVKVIDSNGVSECTVIAVGPGLVGAIIIECAHSYKDARKLQQHKRG